MSPRLVIAAQFGVVIGLAGVVWFQSRQLAAARRELAHAGSLPAELSTNTGQRPLRLRLQQLPPINLPTRVEKLDWKSLESDDYATYVANLRAAGCPEETIRDILVADVNKLYAARIRALRPTTPDLEYWRSDPTPLSPEKLAAEKERETAELELERERRQLLDSLLGPAAARLELAEFTRDALDDRALQFLPAEKREAIAAAEARQRQALAELELIADPAAREAREEEIRKAYDDALAASLSPEERHQLDLRTSPLASSLRERLRGFGASREEFETLYRLEASHARERAELEADLAARNDPAAAEKLEATDAEFEQSLARTLGQDRFREFQRSQDPDYQTLYNLTQEHSVPQNVAAEVWDMRGVVEEQTDRIRDNPLLTAEQKIAAFQAIRSETQSAIVEVLGEPLLQEYRRQGGSWLNELTDIRNLGETDRPVVPPPLPDQELEAAAAAAAAAANPGTQEIFPRRSRFRRNR